MKYIKIATFTFLLGLAACATSDPFAETLEARGQSASSLATNYNRGQKLIENGQDNIKDGRKMVNKGNSRIDKGREQISEGEALKASARAAYCAQVGPQDQACI